MNSTKRFGLALFLAGAAWAGVATAATSDTVAVSAHVNDVADISVTATHDFGNINAGASQTDSDAVVATVKDNGVNGWLVNISVAPGAAVIQAGTKLQYETSRGGGINDAGCNNLRGSGFGDIPAVAETAYTSLDPSVAPYDVNDIDITSGVDVNFDLKLLVDAQEPAGDKTWTVTYDLVQQ